jgi:hypothetical protein
METPCGEPYRLAVHLSPHSLGKLIEWKPREVHGCGGGKVDRAPHSLGKLIEWKLILKGVKFNPKN